MHSAREPNVERPSDAPVASQLVVLQERYHRTFDDEAGRLVMVAARLCGDLPDTPDENRVALHVVGLLVQLRRALAHWVAYAEAMVLPQQHAVDAVDRFRKHLHTAHHIRSQWVAARDAVVALPCTSSLQPVLRDGLDNLAKLFDDALALERGIVDALVRQHAPVSRTG